MAEPALNFRNLDDFLAWERQQGERWEWYGGPPVAMTGTTLVHNIICGNLRNAIHPPMRSRGCRAFSESVKVISASTVLYPDVVASCAPVTEGEDIVRDPILVIEILSPSTSSYDRNAKRALYRLIPTLDHYLVVSQSQLRVEVDTKTEDGWATAHIIGHGATVALPRLGLEIAMATIYDDTGLTKDGV